MERLCKHTENYISTSTTTKEMKKKMKIPTSLFHLSKIIQSKKKKKKIMQI